MKAFFGSHETKQKYIDRVKKHREMDNLVQRIGWDNGKGCAVGCTLEKYDHAQYEPELGIPEWLAHVEDVIFEGLPKEDAMAWPERFLSAIKPGARLNEIKTPFLIFILEQNLTSLDALEFDKLQFPDVEKAIQMTRVATVEMMRCHRTGEDLSEAAKASEAAAWAAGSAARSAGSAAWLAAVWAAAGVAGSAAWSAGATARSAGSAAWLAGSAAWLAGATGAARSVVYQKYATELIRLIEGCG